MTEQERFDYLLEFKEYSKEWERYGFLRCLQMFMDKHQIYTRSLSQEQGDRKVSNLFQIREILHEQEKAKGLGISGLLRFLKEKIESTDKDDEQYLERLETDEQAVKIMTIHKSKGLEFPVVFCPYMWTEKFMESSHSRGEFNSKSDFTYHDDERGTLLSLDPDDAHRDAQRRSWRRETLGEQLRLLYVALTRSANRCYLYWGNIENHKKNKNGAITKNSLFPSVFEFLANKNQSGQGIQENDPLPMDLSARRKFWQEELAGNNSATTFNEIYPVHHLASCKYTSHTLDTLIEPPSLQLQFPLWMDGSYSALIRRHEKVQFTPDEGPKDDESESSSMSDEDEIISGFFAFPRGAMPGTCIHEIFEFIDFQDESKWEEVISEKLSKYNLHGLNRPDHEKFLKARIRDCKEMLRTVLSTNLKGSDFALKDISKHQRMDELSFHYPVKDIQLKKLQALFAKHYPTGEKLAYAQDLDKLNYRMDEGYFNGSIDLTFQHEGKFYIVDWKSNYLGSQANQYHEKQLNKAVREHFYFLQYHIYSLALHLYLESHLHDYHYEKHFGSCIYAFIRGFEIGTDFGMHYDRVPLGLIEDMKQLFVHGEYAHV